MQVCLWFRSKFVESFRVKSEVYQRCYMCGCIVGLKVSLWRVLELRVRCIRKFIYVVVLVIWFVQICRVKNDVELVVRVFHYISCLRVSLVESVRSVRVQIQIEQRVGACSYVVNLRLFLQRVLQSSLRQSQELQCVVMLFVCKLCYEELSS